MRYRIFLERKINTFERKKLHLSDEHLRHFGNTLMRMVIEWQMKFKEDIKNKTTFEDTKIEGK